MSAWTPDQLVRIGGSEELGLASRRADGSLRPFITMWVVRSADDIFVRSAHGRDNPWFQRALTSGLGRVRVGGMEQDVTFEEPGPAVDADVDRAYHVKYDRYGPAIVGSVVSPEARRSTLRVIPR